MKFSTYLSIVTFLATAGTSMVSTSSVDAIGDSPLARRHHHANLAHEVERAEMRRALQARVVDSKVIQRAQTPVDNQTSKRFIGLDDGTGVKKRSGKKKCTTEQKLRKAAKKYRTKHHKSHDKHKKHKHHKHKAHSATATPTATATTTPTATQAAKQAVVGQADDEADELVDCDSTSSTQAAATSPAAEAKLGNVKQAATSNDDDDDDDNKSSAKASSSSTKSASGSGSTGITSVAGSIGKGLFGMSFGGQCSSPDADEEHPNGSMDFLTCGISKSNPSSVWNPPHVKLNQLKVISADQAAKADVFSACAPYKSHFQNAEQSTGVPAVLLMSFALQESSCQPNQMGPNGEFGMMQITKDKCGGAPGGNCRDVDFNIRTGAKYLVDTINGQCGGNALCGIGQYNGWQAGKMTYSSATNTQWGCYAQNNLDYLSSLLNGWAQGQDGNSKQFIKFNNLARCG